MNIKQNYIFNKIDTTKILPINILNIECQNKVLLVNNNNFYDIYEYYTIIPFQNVIVYDSSGLIQYPTKSVQEGTLVLLNNKNKYFVCYINSNEYNDNTNYIYSNTSIYNGTIIDLSTSYKLNYIKIKLLLEGQDNKLYVYLDNIYNDYFILDITNADYISTDSIVEYNDSTILVKEITIINSQSSIVDLEIRCNNILNISMNSGVKIIYPHLLIPYSNFNIYNINTTEVNILDSTYDYLYGYKYLEYNNIFDPNYLNYTNDDMTTVITTFDIKCNDILNLSKYNNNGKIMIDHSKILKMNNINGNYLSLDVYNNSNTNITNYIFSLTPRNKFINNKFIINVDKTNAPYHIIDNLLNISIGSIPAYKNKNVKIFNSPNGYTSNSNIYNYFDDFTNVNSSFQIYNKNNKCYIDTIIKMLRIDTDSELRSTDISSLLNSPNFECIFKIYNYVTNTSTLYFGLVKNTADIPIPTFYSNIYISKLLNTDNISLIREGRSYIFRIKNTGSTFIYSLEDVYGNIIDYKKIGDNNINKFIKLLNTSTSIQGSFLVDYLILNRINTSDPYILNRNYDINNNFINKKYYLCFKDENNINKFNISIDITNASEYSLNNKTFVVSLNKNLIYNLSRSDFKDIFVYDQDSSSYENFICINKGSQYDIFFNTSIEAYSSKKIDILYGNEFIDSNPYINSNILYKILYFDSTIDLDNFIFDDNNNYIINNRQVNYDNNILYTFKEIIDPSAKVLDILLNNKNCTIILDDNTNKIYINISNDCIQVNDNQLRIYNSKYIDIKYYTYLNYGYVNVRIDDEEFIIKTKYLNQYNLKIIPKNSTIYNLIIYDNISKSEIYYNEFKNIYNKDLYYVDDNIVYLDGELYQDASTCNVAIVNQNNYQIPYIILDPIYTNKGKLYPIEVKCKILDEIHILSNNLYQYNLNKNKSNIEIIPKIYNTSNGVLEFVNDTTAYFNNCKIKINIPVIENKNYLDQVLKIKNINDNNLCIKVLYNIQELLDFNTKIDYEYIYINPNEEINILLNKKDYKYISELIILGEGQIEISYKETNDFQMLSTEKFLTNENKILIDSSIEFINIKKLDSYNDYILFSFDNNVRLYYKNKLIHSIYINNLIGSKLFYSGNFIYSIIYSNNKIKIYKLDSHNQELQYDITDHNNISNIEVYQNKIAVISNNYIFRYEMQGEILVNKGNIYVNDYNFKINITLDNCLLYNNNKIFKLSDFTNETTYTLPEDFSDIYLYKNKIFYTDYNDNLKLFGKKIFNTNIKAYKIEISKDIIKIYDDKYIYLLDEDFKIIRKFYNNYEYIGILDKIIYTINKNIICIYNNYYNYNYICNRTPLVINKNCITDTEDGIIFFDRFKKSLIKVQILNKIGYYINKVEIPSIKYKLGKKILTNELYTNYIQYKGINSLKN